MHRKTPLNALAALLLTIWLIVLLDARLRRYNRRLRRDTRLLVEGLISASKTHD
jgi:hypothetical protein